MPGFTRLSSTPARTTRPPPALIQQLKKAAIRLRKARRLMTAPLFHSAPLSKLAHPPQPQTILISDPPTKGHAE